MTKVLILGATGNLGSLTAAVLAADHRDVVLRLASSREKGRATLREHHPRAEVVAADWYDADSLRPAIRGVDKMFIVTPDFTTDENVVTPNIIRAIKAEGGVTQILRLIAMPAGFTADKLSPAVLATRCGAAQHVIARPLLDASGLPVTYLNVPCWIDFNLPWFMAGEVKMHRRLAMPARADAPRLWISETDVAEVAAKILAGKAAKHVGKEYILTGTEHYDFRQLAALLTEVLGEKVVFVDNEEPLRAAMGENFEKLMTYFTHETRDYRNVPVTDTVQRMLGRPPLSLRDYIRAHKSDFL
jgi:uncharacterized protein YbjT (DUF2867 family)